jgi:sugar transferase (PEP-CTERM system associated)
MTTPTRFTLGAGQALILLDAVLALLAWQLAVGQAAPATPALLLLLFPAGFLLLVYALGLYRRDALLATRRSIGRAPVAAVLGALLASVAAKLVGLALPEWRQVALAPLFVWAVICFSCTAFLARLVLALLRRRGAFRRRLLIVGAGYRAFDLVTLLRREGRMLGYDIAFLHEPAMGPVDERLAADPAGGRIIPLGPGGFLPVAREMDAEQIVVAPDERRGLSMRSLLDCRLAGYPVQEYMQFLEREIGRVDVKRLEFSWLLYSDGFTFGPFDRVLKRLLDISASGFVLLLTAPLLLLAMLAVRLEDGGPALYRQERVTMGGRVFRIMKLRTMRVDSERNGAVWAAAGDPRITRIGNFLRRTRLDEIPQLFNVLRGDMSFVGPRPERPEFTRELAAALPLYEERHVVRAGLTGWAQVNYPYGASLDDARSKLSYDLYYVKNFSLLFDLLIILQTLRVVLFPGASGAR